MSAPAALPISFRRLWSLGDLMERFSAVSLGHAVSILAKILTVIAGADAANIRPDRELERAMANGELVRAEAFLADLPLSIVLKAQLSRLKFRINHGAETIEISILFREFLDNLLVEMGAPHFLMIRTDRKEFFEQKELPFGKLVASVFFEANADISAASRCYALDEWTACVFHLMRVLEHGLRVLADKVGLDGEAMAHENWKNVIDQIESKIRAIEGEKKSPDKIERLRSLSSAAVQFRYFKDAWRNHVSHSHASYDERDGQTIWTHVRAFTIQMAEAVSSQEKPS
jgi:hypothetical protein